MDDANQSTPGTTPSTTPDVAPSQPSADPSSLMGPTLTPEPAPINSAPLNSAPLGAASMNIPTTPTHELQPLGQPPAKSLDAATWAGQSLVVALVLGGVALVAYALKRRQVAAGHAHGSRRKAIDEPLEHDAEYAEERAAPVRAFAGAMGASDAMRDEIAALRAEIESTRDEAVELRREVAALRMLVERGSFQRDERNPSRGASGQVAANGAANDARSETPQVEPKPARESVEQRVLALAARGESSIAIAQRTGVPTGQVELMLNLARASGRA